MRSRFRPVLPSPVVAIGGVVLAIVVSCSQREEGQAHRTFRTPEDAVHALNRAVAKGNVDEILAIFGPDGRELVDESDPATARQNREVYTVAVNEGWRLVDSGPRKELVIGNEAWPFPVPLVKEEAGWRFDTAAGKEEVLTRRIGRNELNAIRACHAYVLAQRRYVRDGHDGRPAGTYARTLRSDPGKHNGLYWPVSRGERRSPLGDLLQEAEVHSGGAAGQALTPFHGYYFRILTAQGDAAADGAMSYLDGGQMSRGFALVAWPARYERTGIMTFIVNQSGVVHEKDLGPDTDAAARNLTRYDPDGSWRPVQYR